MDADDVKKFLADDVREYLGNKHADVRESTIRNYLAHAIDISEGVTGSAKYKQEARDTAECSLRRVQAFAALICAISIRPGKSVHQPPASKRNDACYNVMKALGHGDAYVINGGMYFNVEIFP